MGRASWAALSELRAILVVNRQILITQLRENQPCKDAATRSCAAAPQHSSSKATSTGQDSPSRTDGGKKGSCPVEKR